jgi:hypothetical protein
MFAAYNSLALPDPCTLSQRYIIAPLAIRKPLQQRPKMSPLSRPQLRAATTTKLRRTTYMKRAHDAGVAEAPHLGLGVRAQHLDRRGRDGLCYVLGPLLVQAGVQSKQRRRCQLLQRRRIGRENAPHEASQRTEVEQVHTIRA